MKIHAILLVTLLTGLARAGQSPSLGDQALGTLQGAGDQMMAGLTGTGPAANGPENAGSESGSTSDPSTGAEQSQQQPQVPAGTDQAGQPPESSSPPPPPPPAQGQPPLTQAPVSQPPPLQQPWQQQPQKPLRNYIKSQQQPPQQQQPQQSEPPVAQAPPSPLTADEMAAMDLKMATIRDALSVLLDFRKQHPQLSSSPELQNLYHMLEPIVQAADQVDSCSPTPGANSCPGAPLTPTSPMAGGNGLQSRRPLRRSPQQPAMPLINHVQPPYL